jgi:hypothetical protein
MKDKFNIIILFSNLIISSRILCLTRIALFLLLVSIFINLILLLIHVLILCSIFHNHTIVLFLHYYWCFILITSTSTCSRISIDLVIYSSNILLNVSNFLREDNSIMRSVILSILISYKLGLKFILRLTNRIYWISIGLCYTSTPIL